MNKTTPKDADQTLTKLHNSATAQVVGAIAALNRLQARIEAGEVGPKSDATKVLGDIRDWLKIAHEMEVRLEKQSQIAAGGHGGQAPLDLDAARSAIGCRLDRLRRAGCPGCVPK